MRPFATACKRSKVGVLVITPVGDNLQWVIVIAAIYSLQNIENEKKLRNVFFGLVCPILQLDC